MLVQLDTDRLDNDIQKREQTLRALEDELTRATDLLESLARQLEADTAAIEAKPTVARTDTRAKGERQAGHPPGPRRSCGRSAGDPLRRLVIAQAVTQAEPGKATAKYARPERNSRRPELPVEDGQERVLTQELAQAKATNTVKRQEAEAWEGQAGRGPGGPQGPGQPAGGSETRRASAPRSAGSS